MSPRRRFEKKKIWTTWEISQADGDHTVRRCSSVAVWQNLRVEKEKKKKEKQLEMTRVYLTRRLTLVWAEWRHWGQLSWGPIVWHQLHFCGKKMTGCRKKRKIQYNAYFYLSIYIVIVKQKYNKIDLFNVSFMSL